MKNQFIEKSSKMLAEYDFGNLTETVTFHFIVYFNDGSEIRSSLGLNVRYVNDPFTMFNKIQLWDDEAWQSCIENLAKIITSSWYTRGAICEFDVIGVSFGLRTVWNDRIEVIWRPDAGFEAIHFTKRIEDEPSISIPLDGIDVRSSKDIAKLVCAKTGYKMKDFVRID